MQNLKYKALSIAMAVMTAASPVLSSYTAYASDNVADNIVVNDDGTVSQTFNLEDNNDDSSEEKETKFLFLEYGELYASEQSNVTFTVQVSNINTFNEINPVVKVLNGAGEENPEAVNFTTVDSDSGKIYTYNVSLKDDEYISARRISEK